MAGTRAATHLTLAIAACAVVAGCGGDSKPAGPETPKQAWKRIGQEAIQGHCRHIDRIYLRAAFPNPVTEAECAEDFGRVLPDLTDAQLHPAGTSAVLVDWPYTEQTLILLRDTDGLFKLAIYQAKEQNFGSSDRDADRVAAKALRVIGGKGVCRDLVAVSLVLDRKRPDRFCRSPLVTGLAEDLAKDPAARPELLVRGPGIVLYELRLRTGRAYNVVVVDARGGHRYLNSYPTK
jgi:hypothetical protein